MSAVRRSFPAYKAPGDENFRHGAETYRMRTGNLEAKRERQRTLNQNLTLQTMQMSVIHSCGSWTSEQLKELWHLRYERKPKYTYDMLSKKFNKPDTWGIVNALCELQNRKKSGGDMWEPIGQVDIDPTKPVVYKRTPRRKIRDDQWKRRAFDLVELRAKGMSYERIGKARGHAPSHVRSIIKEAYELFPEETKAVESKTKK